jgi:hypothetical protein
LDVSGRHSLRDGQIADDTLGSEIQGTWIRQTDESRNFTDTGLATSWTLFSSANGARNFRIFANQPTETNGTSAFTVTATESPSSTWTLWVGNDKVSMKNSKGTIRECSVSGTPPTTFWVNVSAGTVEGTDCDGLGFGPHLDRIETVTFDNAENITGSYQLIANDTEGDVHTGQYDDASGPFVEKGVYGTRIEIDFQRDSLTYRADRRVVPGETDD